MEEEQIMNQIPVLNLPFRLFWPLGLVSYEGLKTEVFTNILSFQIRVLCTSNYEINLHLSACRFNTAGCALSLSLSLSLYQPQGHITPLLYILHKLQENASVRYANIIKIHFPKHLFLSNNRIQNTQDAFYGMLLRLKTALL